MVCLQGEGLHPRGGCIQVGGMPWGLHPGRGSKSGGSASGRKGSVSREVCMQGERGSLHPGGWLGRPIPELEKRTVRILLECFLVSLFLMKH